MGVKKETKLGANDIWEVMFTQRAIRYWVEEPVSRELIERVIEAASKAPSGSNHQPWMFVVADRDPVKTSLAEALRDYYEEGPLKTLVESSQKTEDSSQRLMMSGAENFFTNLRTAPAIIIPCLYKLSSPTSEMNTLDCRKFHISGGPEYAACRQSVRTWNFNDDKPLPYRRSNSRCL